MGLCHLPRCGGGGLPGAGWPHRPIATRADCLCLPWDPWRGVGPVLFFGRVQVSGPPLCLRSGSLGTVAVQGNLTV